SAAPLREPARCGLSPCVATPRSDGPDHAGRVFGVNEEPTVAHVAKVGVACPGRGRAWGVDRRAAHKLPRWTRPAGRPLPHAIVEGVEAGRAPSRSAQTTILARRRRRVTLLAEGATRCRHP